MRHFPICKGERQPVYDNHLGGLYMVCSVCGHERLATSDEFKQWKKQTNPPPAAEQQNDAAADGAGG